MQSLKLSPALFYSHPLLNHLSSNSVRSFLLSLSTGSLSTQAQYLKESASLIDYLNANFKFSKSQSVYIAKHVSATTFPEKPLSMMRFFKQIGFSETQIRNMILQRPQVLFSDVDKTLRPKIELFQRSGFEGSELCMFISKNPTVLTASLKKALVPSVEAIRRIVHDEKEFVQVLRKCGPILPKYRKFVDNITFLESLGIVGSQLSMLLKRQSRLLTAQQSKVKSYALRAVDMGFHENSRMFVHALLTICGLSFKTFSRKLELIQCFGFSKDESLQMFKRSPGLLRTSEKKLKVGVEFFLHTVMLSKSVLVHRPMILMYSIEDRVIPRYRVFQLLISKKLCKKVPSYISVLCLSEEMFLDKYISRFRENAVELLVAYKGHCLDV